MDIHGCNVHLKYLYIHPCSYIYIHVVIYVKNTYTQCELNEYQEYSKYRWIFYVILRKSVATLDMSVHTCTHLLL